MNVMIRSECPREIRELIFVGTLIALSKKSGGLRPIAIGYVWRSKCTNEYLFCDQVGAVFAPNHLGIASTSGEGEAAVHAARSFVKRMQEKQIFVKLDIANAFNSMRRDLLYAFIHQAYSQEFNVQCGDSWCGLGTVNRWRLCLLFCLPLQSRPSSKIGVVGLPLLGWERERGSLGKDQET